MEKKRYHNIDFLRIVLISAIILHHFIHAATGHWNSGGYAVEFFFVIAGFVFYMTYKAQKSLSEYVVEKLIKFMPLLICTSLTLAFCTKFKGQQFLADIFLMQKTGLYVSNGGFGYNTPAWFVSVLFWVLLFIFSLRKNLKEETANLILGTMAFFAFIIYANKQNVLYTDPRIFRGFSAICVGYFSGIITKYLENTFIIHKSKIITMFEILITSYLFNILFTFSKITNKLGLVFLMGVIVILFSLRKGYFSTLLNREIFTKISAYIFPIFITHSLLYHSHPIFKYFKQICDNTIVICVVGFIASWLLGIIAYHFLQIPIERYLKQIFSVIKAENPCGSRERERERERE